MRIAGSVGDGDEAREYRKPVLDSTNCYMADMRNKNPFDRDALFREALIEIVMWRRSPPNLNVLPSTLLVISRRLHRRRRSSSLSADFARGHGCQTYLEVGHRLGQVRTIGPRV